MDIDGALVFLDGHVNLETDVRPSAAARRLDRMAEMVGLLGDPQQAYPVIHITGTNGKGSVARILTALLRAQGLSVGTYTSPHLERVNERLAWGGESIADEALAEVLGAVALTEPYLTSPPTYFELLTAAAYRWFADVAVDVAVVEVGLGGRWDATNVADGTVAVVTNVSADHAEVIGPERSDIAKEKAGIVKAGATLVLGETDQGLASVFDATAARVGVVGTVLRDRDFGWTSNELAHGGRALDLFTPQARYDGVHLSLHGAFQADNAAAAVAAAEAFLGVPLAEDLVSEALGSVRVPGRMEVVARRPLCVLDGAHNPAGAVAATAAVAETFAGVVDRVLVVGLLRGRDPAEMLGAFDAGRARLVVACPPPSPRALPAAAVADAARALGTPAEEAVSVSEAVATALALAQEKDLVLVTGSLYVVGAARQLLV